MKFESNYSILNILQMLNSIIMVKIHRTRVKAYILKFAPCLHLVCRMKKNYNCCAGRQKQLKFGSHAAVRLFTFSLLVGVRLFTLSLHAGLIKVCTW